MTTMNDYYESMIGKEVVIQKKYYSLVGTLTNLTVGYAFIKDAFWIINIKVTKNGVTKDDHEFQSVGDTVIELKKIGKWYNMRLLEDVKNKLNEEI